MTIAKSPSQRRMAENQVVFRTANVRIQNWFSKFLQHAKRETNGASGLSADQPVSFMCECSDENCRDRIDVPYSAYKKIHKAPDEFTIALGHEVPEIEDIVSKASNYCVVKKHEVPDQSKRLLQATEVDNS